MAWAEAQHGEAKARVRIGWGDWGLGVDDLVEENIWTCYLFGKFSLDDFTLGFFVVSSASS